MDNILFSNSFTFTSFLYTHLKHTDNSGGIDSHYIGWLRKGSARIEPDNGEVLHLQAGDVFYLPRGLQYHSYWIPNQAEDGKAELESFRFTYFPCKTDKHYALQKITPDGEAFAFLELLTENKRVTCTSIGYLYAFLGRAFPTMQVADADSQKALLSRARRYISEHPDFQVAQLARYCHMSESALYAFFKSYAKCTPIEMKNAILAENAVSLLTSTDLTVERIGERLGLQSVAYFRRIVKDHTGKTPTEIRREHQQKKDI